MERKQNCTACGYQGPLTSILRESGVHYAEWRCPECNKHHGFIPKPDGDSSRQKREPSHRELVKKFGKGFCECCLTKEGRLRKGRTLEAHHVIEYQDGGTAERDNLWILCTACHQQVHWIRTYHGTIEPLGDSLTKWRDE